MNKVSLPNPCRIVDFSNWACKKLKQADLFYGHGSSDALDEANWLSSYIAGFNFDETDKPFTAYLTKEQVKCGVDLLNQRITTKQPLAYLIKQAWFAGFRFYVDERALIPRSHLGEWVGECFSPWIDTRAVKQVLDLCCGSGCIGIALALNGQEYSVDLADLSVPALEVAQININNYQLNDRVKTIQSDLYSNITSQYDLIVSNPPYVSCANMQTLPAEFEFEPELALVAGTQGLDSILKILINAHHYLTDNGSLVMEIGSAKSALETYFPKFAFNWLMSINGEDVVLVIDIAQLKSLSTQIRAN